MLKKLKFFKYRWFKYQSTQICMLISAMYKFIEVFLYIFAVKYQILASWGPINKFYWMLLSLCISNHMVLRVIWEKSSRSYLTKFWNHPERSEGNFNILLNNQGMIFPKSPEMTMWFLANHILLFITPHFKDTCWRGHVSQTTPPCLVLKLFI